jgi:hypothetical protein
MSIESTRNWSRTYVFVLLIEALAIGALWLLSWRFSY